MVGAMTACGGEGSTPTTGEESTSAATMGAATTGPATTTTGDDPLGTGTTSWETDNSEGSSGGQTDPTAADDAPPPPPDAPVMVSFERDPIEITMGESVTFTAVLSDTDGPQDIVGGKLLGLKGDLEFGEFVATDDPWVYTLTLSWEQFNAVSPIEFENYNHGTGAYIYQARFYDTAGHFAYDHHSVHFACEDEGSACGGVCTDLAISAEHCGACNNACDGVCAGGQCGQ